jgi:hypothetical protein
MIRLHAVAAHPDRNFPMTRALKPLALALGLMALAGCVVYEPVTLPQPSPAQRYDRYWDAALAAMAEQGVTVTSQDRASGVIRGARNGVSVTTVVQSQADGSVQVSFETSRAGNQEPGLARALSDSFSRRIGR